MIDSIRTIQNERRVHHEVREIFVRACTLLAPFFKDNKEAPGVSKFAMTHMLSDHFPTLSGSQTQIVISTVERLHREGRLQTLLENQTRAPGT
ncbi:MAG: hypothetical protein HZC43_06935 [Nitrosomonadales bacterium]|nr:hypothetical protein [Nitrosomonadales bacterium]